VKQIISHEKAMSLEDTFILYTSAYSKNLELHQPMSAIVKSILDLLLGDGLIMLWGHQILI
jgi:hypothetical protein